MTLAEVLRAYMRKADFTPGLLAKLSGLPKATIINWLEGRVARPRQWQHLIRVADALRLDEPDASQLLQAAGHRPMHDLRAQATESERALFARWRLALVHPASIDPASLADAARLLATMPIDAPVLPAPLPIGSMLPLSRNPLFVGREHDLYMLAMSLKGEPLPTRVCTVIVAGIGGIGKTQLASEFAHCYGQFFAGGVFWISCEDATAIPSQIARCGGLECMALHPEFNSLPLEQQLRLTTAAWQSPLPRLLVFDNCEEEAILDRWRPSSGGCRVLVTSRRQQWDAALGARVLPLQTLSRADSLVLLRRHRADLAIDDPELDSIAAELGDLPLALHLAGSYLARYQHLITLAAYVSQLRGAAALQHQSLQHAGFSPTRHQQHVARTFALSYERLDRADAIDRAALQLLACAAYFAPGEPIDRALLLASLNLPGGDLDASLQAEEALMRLINLGLLEKSSQTSFQMHRLLAGFVQERAPIPNARQIVEQTILDTANRLSDTAAVTPILALQPHLSFITAMAMQRDDLQAADLCSAQGYHAWLMGHYSQARVYFERAFSIHSRRSNPDHLKLAGCLNLLGLTHQLLANFQQAQEIFEQALGIWQQHLGDQDPFTAAEHNNLGYLLLLRGNYPQAERHLHQALHVRRRLFGLHNHETARSLNNLGYLSMLQGYYRRASRYTMLALSIRKQVLPEYHIAIATTLNVAGEVRYAQGRYQEAWEHHQQALRVRQHLFGTEHHHSAESLYNLGRVLHAQGDLAQADTYLTQAHTINATLLGPGHRETLFILTSIGALRRDQGRRSEARSCGEQAVHGWVQQLGYRHPHTATAIHLLGRICMDQQEYDQARLHLEHALAIRQALLAWSHPDRAHSLLALGTLWHRLGDDHKAHGCIKDALSAFMRSVPGHPQIAACVRALEMLESRSCAEIEQ